MAFKAFGASIQLTRYIETTGIIFNIDFHISGDTQRRIG